jgi:hypothetical protein
MLVIDPHQLAASLQLLLVALPPIHVLPAMATGAASDIAIQAMVKVQKTFHFITIVFMQIVVWVVARVLKKCVTMR